MPGCQGPNDLWLKNMVISTSVFNVRMECIGVLREGGAYLIVDKKYYEQGETFAQN